MSLSEGTLRMEGATLALASIKYLIGGTYFLYDTLLSLMNADTSSFNSFKATFELSGPFDGVMRAAWFFFALLDLDLYQNVLEGTAVEKQPG